MNHAEQVKAQDATTRGRLLKFANQPEVWVAEMILESGADWLEKLYQDTAARAHANASKQFWAWFQNQWRITDNLLSERLKVDKAGVIQYKSKEGHTHFIHSHEEFTVFYSEHHSVKIGRMLIPAELAGRWVANGKATE